FENVAQFRYLGKTITNQNLIQERRLNSGNACYHSVQNFLSPRVLSKTIILTVVLYGCDTWSLILKLLVVFLKGLVANTN
ncbi:hypothetical protein B7P43_G06051, partial [Cryptotermes secundus]